MVEKQTFNQIKKEDLANMTEKEITEMLNKTFYTTTYQSVGEKCDNTQPSEYGLNGHFTKHLQHAGMWRNNSLHTTVDKERFMDGSKDWMDKIN